MRGKTGLHLVKRLEYPTEAILQSTEPACGPAQTQDRPVSLYRQLLPQPVRRGFFRLRGDQIGPALACVFQGLALERGVNNVGPMAPAAIQALESMGIRDAERYAQFPAQVTADDLEKADKIIALKKDEHLPCSSSGFLPGQKRLNSGTLTMHPKPWP